jgi:hypothetical protein
MRLFADENFPRPIVEVLRSNGHDVIWVRTDSPGLKDRTLLERAEADGRVIFTFGKDFWQLALQRPIVVGARQHRYKGWNRDDPGGWAFTPAVSAESSASARGTCT